MGKFYHYKYRKLYCNIVAISSTLKRAIIITAQVGQGHMSVALALEYWLTQWGYNPTIIDITPANSEKIYKTLLKSPKAYKSLFNFSDNVFFSELAVDNFTNYAEQKLKKILPLYTNSDIILSAYPLMHPKMGKKQFVLLLDPTVHASYVANPDIGQFIAFWDKSIEDVKQKQPKILGKLFFTGPLTRAAFYNYGSQLKSFSDKSIFKARLGLDPKKKIALITAGGNWIDRSKKYIDLMRKELSPYNVTLAFVCGNTKFKASMTDFYGGSEDLIFLDWLSEEQMATWMCAADFVLAFSLAQTLVEAGLCLLPIYCFQLIEGQEDFYKHILHKNKIGAFIDGKPKEQVNKLKAYLAHPGKNLEINCLDWQKYLSGSPEGIKKVLLT